MTARLLCAQGLARSAGVFLLLVICHPLSSGYAEDVPQCPVGYFRNSLLVFPCNREGDKKSYSVATRIVSGHSQDVGVVPVGLKSLDITANFEVPVSPISGQNVPVFLQLFNGQGKSSSDIRGQDLLGPRYVEGESSFSYHGITITDSQTSRKERVGFSGVVPINLLAVLNDSSTTHGQARVLFTYSYDGFVDGKCSEPVACTKYDKTTATATCEQFTKWMDTQYDGVYMQAYADLGVSSLLDNSNFLHFHSWPSLWSRWPSGALNPWQACFDLLDSLIKRDGLVSEAELEKAFSFHRVHPSLSMWSGILHGASNAQTADQAWTSVYKGSGSGISQEDWTSKWDVWPAPDSLEKVSGETSFDYIDSDDDGFISQAEFQVAYDLFYMGHPLSLQEIHKSTAQAAGPPVVSSRLTNPSEEVSDAALVAPTFQITPNATEDDAGNSGGSSGSMPEPSGGSLEASSGDSNGWVIFTIVASAIIAMFMLALCILLAFKLKEGKLLAKSVSHKHRGLVTGPSESRMSRELRGGYNHDQYEPVMPSGDHLIESGPLPKPALQPGQQDPLMQEVARLRLALSHETNTVPPMPMVQMGSHMNGGDQVFGGPQQLQSPMVSIGSVASPGAPAVMYSYASLPVQSPPQLTPQLAPLQPVQFSPSVNAQSEASSGYGLMQFSQPQYFASGFGQQVVPENMEFGPNVQY